ncbi:tRNA 2-thiouridine synthesizing protein C [Methylomarinovum tepidoasis]|uniref:tRNA 2-thiouridine synthesizing protein C n=1 Tax=Methylomarinovum tepidoasis TaxID=2840183 RepID=A0AAU9CBT3_9GAMM|nr:sulfurtransferase complex subunit TusC [Methylomarinovum sp. IN45]BCX88186.1 tRNA 2-thiouridine synthesizing protein C [Methylomarinovum sp. IN45]
MRFLYVFRHPPYADSGGGEALDLLLTLAAFDQTVEVLLLDDGVWHLAPGQQPARIGQRRLPDLWQGLGLYGIEKIWVGQESLQRRGLTPERLILPVGLVAEGALAQWWGGYDRIVGD